MIPSPQPRINWDRYDKSGTFKSWRATEVPFESIYGAHLNNGQQVHIPEEQPFSDQLWGKTQGQGGFGESAISPAAVQNIAYRGSSVAKQVRDILTAGRPGLVNPLPAHIANGAAGNIWQESTFRPLAVGAAGERGIGQWDKTRYAAMVKWTMANGLDPASLEGQTFFYSHELQDKPRVMAKLGQVRTAAEAAHIIGKDFERASIQGKRVAYAASLAGEPVGMAATAGGSAVPKGRAAVRDLQTDLLAHGFDPGQIDGRLGKNTRAAVKAAEQEYGLPFDRGGIYRGIAGPQVMAALDAHPPLGMPPGGFTPAVGPFADSGGVSAVDYAAGNLPPSPGGIGLPTPGGVSPSSDYVTAPHSLGPYITGDRNLDRTGSAVRDITSSGFGGSTDLPPGYRPPPPAEPWAPVETGAAFDRQRDTPSPPDFFGPGGAGDVWGGASLDSLGKGIRGLFNGGSSDPAAVPMSPAGQVHDPFTTQDPNKDQSRPPTSPPLGPQSYLPSSGAQFDWQRYADRGVSSYAPPSSGNTTSQFQSTFGGIQPDSRDVLYMNGGGVDPNFFDAWPSRKPVSSREVQYAGPVPEQYPTPRILPPFQHKEPSDPFSDTGKWFGGIAQGVGDFLTGGVTEKSLQAPTARQSPIFEPAVSAGGGGWGDVSLPTPHGFLPSPDPNIPPISAPPGSVQASGRVTVAPSVMPAAGDPPWLTSPGFATPVGPDPSVYSMPPVDESYTSVPPAHVVDRIPRLTHVDAPKFVKSIADAISGKPGASGYGNPDPSMFGGSPGAYSFSGYSPWGSATYNAPWGSSGFSNSPFTPSGYTPPSFSSSSGGPTYAYHPDGKGGGTFINSHGETMSY